MTAEEKKLAIKQYCDGRGKCTAYEDKNIGHRKECPLYQVHGCTSDERIDFKYRLLEDFVKTEQETIGAAVLKNASEKLREIGNTLQPVRGQPDLVYHPAHYCYSEYEPKDVIRAWGLNFNLGSAVKYIARAGRKDDILQELNKAKQFIEFEIEAIEKERSGNEK